MTKFAKNNIDLYSVEKQTAKLMFNKNFVAKIHAQT